MLCGATLALLAMRGAAVHYLCATRGEGGELGEPPLCTRAELGETREAELVCAVGQLKGRSLTFLGYTDPAIGPGDTLYAYTDNLTLLAGQIAASIRQFEIHAVLTHGSNGEYGHPAHIVSHQAARIAVESLGAAAPLLYTVAALYPDHPRPRLANKDDPAHLVLGGEGFQTALQAKTQAALCQRTQHALFVRRASQDAGRRLEVAEVIMNTESLHRRGLPAEAALPADDPLAALLQAARLA